MYNVLTQLTELKRTKRADHQLHSRQKCNKDNKSLMFSRIVYEYSVVFIFILIAFQVPFGFAEFPIKDALSVLLFEERRRVTTTAMTMTTHSRTGCDIVNVITGEHSDAGIKQATTFGIWVSSSEYPPHRLRSQWGSLNSKYSASSRLAERVPNIRSFANARNND